MNRMLIVALLFLSCKSQPAKHKNYLPFIENDWKNDKLKGPVRMVVEKEFRNDSLVLELEYEYNSLGFRICKNRTVYNIKEGWGSIKDEYTYDTIKGVMRFDEMGFGTPQGPEDYFYNSKGLVIRDTNYKRNMGHTYSYDLENRLEEKVNIWAGEKHSLHTWTYFPDGSSKECIFNLVEDKKDEEITESDSVKTRKNFVNGRVINTEYYRKDSLGNIVYFSHDLNYGCLSNSGYVKYVFNSNNDQVMEIIHSSGRPASDTTRHTYVYDKAGNWIACDSNKKRMITYW
jgi:hypothetical protein